MATVTEYLNGEMNRLHRECDALYKLPPMVLLGTPEHRAKMLTNLAAMVLLQELASRIEYGVISELGTDSLMEWLPQGSRVD